MQVDTGDTAWILASAALVMFMVPGLALFYGGLVRAKNVLGTVMQSLIALGLVSVIWVLVGYSLAFGSDHGVLGGSDGSAWPAWATSRWRSRPPCPPRRSWCSS